VQYIFITSTPLQQPTCQWARSQINISHRVEIPWMRWITAPHAARP